MATTVNKRRTAEGRATLTFILAWVGKSYSNNRRRKSSEKDTANPLMASTFRPTYVSAKYQPSLICDMTENGVATFSCRSSLLLASGCGTTQLVGRSSSAAADVPKYSPAALTRNFYPILVVS